MDNPLSGTSSDVKVAAVIGESTAGGDQGVGVRGVAENAGTDPRSPRAVSWKSKFLSSKTNVKEACHGIANI